ncbi:MAG: HD domain-containing protein [Nocardioidaceae bacterium]
MTDLRRLWPDLLADNTEIYDRLVAAYGEPHRGYHNLQHLQEVLEHVDAILGAGHASDIQGVDRDVVVLAAWFHDAVYEGSEDEERSAVLAERELATVDVPPLLVEEVARLVRLTAGHRPAPDDRAGQVLCDADLAILAADEDRYAEYTEGVRREYAHVPDAEFRAGRAGVLRDLMESTPLFSSRYGQEHWEERARSNVERELADLDPTRSP